MNDSTLKTVDECTRSAIEALGGSSQEYAERRQLGLDLYMASEEDMEALRLAAKARDSGDLYADIWISDIVMSIIRKAADARLLENIESMTKEVRHD